MGEAKRQITITLSGPAVRNGKVSVGLLAKSLQAFQQALLQIGKEKVDHDASRRGPPPTLVQRQCELFFAEARPGSLETTLELPSPEASLFPEWGQDIGEEALQDLRAVVDSVVHDDPERIRQAIPDSRYRYRVLNTVSAALPREGADYNLSLRVGDSPAFSQVLRPPRERLRALAEVSEVTEEEVPPEEVLVDAVCRAKVRPEAELRPRDITAVIQWEPIEAPDLRPYRPMEVSWGGRRLVLRHEIACGVSREDDLHIVEYEPLGIRAYADSREAAIASFNEEFVVLWDEYASAPDEALSRDAIGLKQRLNELVAREASGDEG